MQNKVNTDEQDANELASMFIGWLGTDRTVTQDGLEKLLLAMAERKDEKFRVVKENAVNWLENHAGGYTWYNEFTGDSGMCDDFLIHFKEVIEF